MNVFGRNRGRVEASSDIPKDGFVHVQILVNWINRDEREINVKVLDRGRGEYVFEASFATSQSEMYAYHTAKDIVRQYVDAEGLVVESGYTDAKLPMVKTTDKRMR
ncbi:hypothetical protein SAMN04487936_107209 [Halobacillus dabanensis]|uniref:Uncharacterized protein n=1 Tax=Halobacillus dabanensis TaxID=240302 RepID=A0A1I3WY20_HALDA|nr:hypothetical protein [Halobacillus dabanensis]SFK12388.1 hypothetical protein SAMN04487936_107209 [Halobacillus dabanensis]